MVEVENELEEAVHLVLLDDPCLAERAQDLQEGLALVNLKLLDRHVRHVYYHYVVAQVGFIEANFGLIKLSPCLFDLCRWYLLLLLGYEVLRLAIESLLDVLEAQLGLLDFDEALLQSRTVGQLVPDKVIDSFQSAPVRVIVYLSILIKNSLLRS